MMEKKQAVLSVEEQESIAEALLRLIAEYPDFPETTQESNIHLNDIKAAGDIGIYPASGAVVTKTYVSGSFEAQYPFDLYYKCNPTNNAAAVSANDVLDGLAKWLETAAYPELSDGRKIQSIRRTTTVVLAGKTEDKSSVYQCGCVLKYYKKKG